MAVDASAPIKFLLNGEPITISDLPPRTTLLEYLRDIRRLTGTKEGCAEGDCGACTVMLAERDPDKNHLGWNPVNACIRFLPSVDGKAVFTVESLQAGDGSLHPVQRALVACHASQCGFCTPGFAMSLFGLYKNAHQPPRAAIDDALSGNLCRCTGYRPIVDAAVAMFDETVGSETAGWRSPGVAADGRRRVSVDEEIMAAKLAALDRAETLRYAHAGEQWLAPRTTDALAAIVLEQPSARIVAGATDIALWVTKQHRDLPVMVSVRDVAELGAIRHARDHLDIGAAATLTAAFAALEREWPELQEVWARFASVPIRNSGTLGGNVANGSPIGDSMPVLLALGASVVLRRGDVVRELPLDEFYVAYQKTALRTGEFVVRVRVPHRRPNVLLRAYKISKRHDQDISAVFACFALAMDGSQIVTARIGCGGVAATPVRALATEAVLAGRRWDDAAAVKAGATLAGEFTPIGDMRASAAYRGRVLGNLVRRFRLETSGTCAPTRVDDVAAGVR